MQHDTANRLFFRLYQCSNLVHRNGTRVVAHHGATTQQWAVLGALVRPSVRAQGMTVKALTGYLMLSRQNLTVVLDRLEGRGWIERVKDPEDGRNRLIRMSEAGQAIWSDMQGPIATFYQQALADLDEGEIGTLLRLLDRLRDGLNRT